MKTWIKNKFRSLFFNNIGIEVLSQNKGAYSLAAICLQQYLVTSVSEGAQNPKIDMLHQILLAYILSVRI